MIKKSLYFGNPSYLSVRNQQLILRYPEVEKNKSLPHHFKKDVETSIPIEDIGMLIIDHKQITITQDLCEKLIENNAAIIWCDSKHHPIGLTLPFNSNDSASEKTRYQVEATEPLKKQLWKQTVEAKILNQAAVLGHFNFEAKQLHYLATQVNSGDATNTEGRAAAIYWSILLEPFDTSRGQFEAAPNNFLNYSYAILRAAVARSLVGSGLLPILGIHHRNKYNPYCLADDIMEPYRPIIDRYVFEFVSQEEYISEHIDTNAKKYLLNLLSLDVTIDGKKSPLMVGLQRTSSSLMKCFMGDSRKILYPIL